MNCDLDKTKIADCRSRRPCKMCNYFVCFFLNCDSTYNYFFGHYEILQGYLEKANLRFYRNACSVCVKGKLIGQCPSDQQTGLEVSSIFFYLTKNRKYRTKCVTVGLRLSLFRAWTV